MFGRICTCGAVDVVAVMHTEGGHPGISPP